MPKRKSLLEKCFPGLAKEKKKAEKKQKPIEFTVSEDFSVNRHDAQITANGGIIAYGDSAYKILKGLIGTRNLFLDFETTSLNEKLKSTNPWRNCWICGIAVCSGKLSDSEYGLPYYIPVNAENEQKVYKYLFDIFSHRNLKCWINHNIKYDVHVLANAAGIVLGDNVQLIDTLTLSKLIDSDRFQHNLTVLSKDWLNEDISSYEIALKPYKHRNQDYGRIPIDIIGPYAIQDVITNRKLYNYIEKNLPETCYHVRDTEIALTSVLVEIERNGLKVDVEQLKQTKISSANKLLQIEEALEKLTGRAFRPHTNDDCFDILCNHFGLPVLGWTQVNPETGEKTAGKPSFDKGTLNLYSAHPSVIADGRIKAVVDGIITYRKIHTFKGLFVETFIDEVDAHGLMHPNYNQSVRTGRLSCSEPNAQQFDKSAKSLIHPYNENDRFVSYDLSQIEFRTIAHYSESRKLIEAYNKNPDTDFHDWTARLCGSNRGTAKTMNFRLGFGGGKKNTQKAVSTSKDLVEYVLKQLEEREFKTDEEREYAFNRLAENRAAEIYNTFHREMPEIKSISKRAELVCKTRGYVFNMFGRQRHLPINRAHTAFNFLNQSTAADIFKERIVFINKLIADSPIKIVANVHDELLFNMPKELSEDKRIIDTLGYLLEHPIFPDDKKFLVPIRVSRGISGYSSDVKSKSLNNHWKEASIQAKLEQYESVVHDLEEFKELICSPK